MNIIFVVGASRSGTTMLNRVLGSHHEILGLNELHYFGDLVGQRLDASLSEQEAVGIASRLLSRQDRGIWAENVTEKDAAVAKEVVTGIEGDRTPASVFTGCVKWLAEHGGKTHVSEQTPRNVYYLAGLIEHIPNVRILHLVRDPRSVVASQKNRWRRKKLGGSAMPWREVFRVWINYHPFTMARLWLRAEEAGHPFGSRTDCYRKLVFEELISQPEKCVREICNFVDVAFESQMLEVPMVGSSQRSDKGVKGFSTDALHGWESVLSQTEIWLIQRVTRKAMEKYGYVPKAVGPGLGLLYFFAIFPLHLGGMLLANPKRLLIQLKGIMFSKGG